MRPDVPPRRSGATSAEWGPHRACCARWVQYREYLNEEQRSQTRCSAGRMQLEFHHGLLEADSRGWR